MIKSLEERINDIKQATSYKIFSGLHQYKGNEAMQEGMGIIARWAMSVINDLQAKLKEETQRADLLSLDLTAAQEIMGCLKEENEKLQDRDENFKINQKELLRCNKELNEEILELEEKLKAKGEL